MKQFLFGLFLVTTILSCSKDEIAEEPCNPANIIIQLAATQIPTGCDKQDGSVTFSVTGGVEPYSYVLNAGFTITAQSQPVFTNLFPGKFKLSVTDKMKCTTTFDFELRLPTKSGVSYSSEVQPIIATHCGLAGCHNGDLGADRDWRTLAAVQKKLNNFQLILALKKMPPAPSAPLSTTDTNLILCWIADGGLNN